MECCESQCVLLAADGKVLQEEVKSLVYKQKLEEIQGPRISWVGKLRLFVMPTLYTIKTF